MSKSLRKDFRREIKKSMSRFISIFLIVVLGVAFYSGIRSSMPTMLATADATYDSENIMDIQVISPLGLTDKDLEAIKKIDGVETAEGVYSIDLICLANSSEIVTRVISLPETINDIEKTIIDGRFPERYDEIMVSPEFLDATGYKIGDKVHFETGTDDDIIDTLAKVDGGYTIVGTCKSSLYLNGQVGTSTIGNGVVGSFVVLPKNAFVLSCYTAINITVVGAKEFNCYGEEYQKKIDKVISQLASIEGKRCEVRYNEFLSTTTDLVIDAEEKYIKNKALVEAELEKSRLKLVQADDYLTKKEEEFAELKNIADNAEEEIPKRKAEIAEAEAEITSGEKRLEDTKKALSDAKIKLQSAQTQVSDAERECLAAEQEYLMAKKAFDECPAENKEEKAALRQAALAKKSTYDDKKEIYESRKMILQLSNEAVVAYEDEITKQEQQLVDAKAKVEEGKKQIAEVESIINDSGKLAEMEKELTTARNDLEKAKQEFAAAESEAKKELEDAQIKLDNTKDKIDNTAVPEWYKLDRNSVLSYASFKNDSESIGAIGTVFPIIFFLVAALVSLTTMTRMVEEQRTQIGTLKALGYSKLSIANKYLLYALLATVFGSIVGVVVGELTLPTIITIAYKSVYYNLGDAVVGFNLEHALVASLAAIICTTFAAYSACSKELKSVPAQLMRPEAPKAAKRTFLERITPIWNRLNFGQKAAIRNLFRYKKRFFMTLFGVGGCMALLLVGLGIRDSVAAMVDNQYNEIFKYDAIVSIDPTLTRLGHNELNTNLNKVSDIAGGVKATRTMVYGSSTGKADDKNEKYAYLIVPEDAEVFTSYVTLRERTGEQKELVLSDEGVIISEKYADLLDVEKGESIFIKLNESDNAPKEVKVIGITENYIMNYIYMTQACYETIYGEAPDLNSIYLSMANAANEAEFKERILALEEFGVNSITMNSEERADLDEIVAMLYFIIIIMVIAAGLLAFVVLYNLNNINISERRRELATLKLLGFYDKETASYVYRENIILTLLGTILGVGLGIILHRFVMTTVETDVYMFGRELNGLSIVIGAVLTIVFAIIVNIVMYFKLKKIDMVESLKSVE